jgi:hypothetical protein
MGEKWASNVSRNIIIRAETTKDGRVWLDVFDHAGKKEIKFESIDEFETFRNAVSKLHIEVKKYHKK